MQDQPIGTPAPGAQPANWYPDPQANDQLRYWDGTQWTSHTRPAGPQAPRSQYRSLGGLAIALYVMLGAFLLLMLGAIVSDLAELSLFNQLIDDPNSVTLEEANASDSRQFLFLSLRALLFLVAAIVFIVWFHRAYSNVPALGMEPLRYGPGWAIGGWFVPVMWWWRPKQIANDVWRGSDPDQPARQDGSWHANPVTWLLLLWWLVFIGSYTVANYATWMGAVNETLPALRTASQLRLTGDVLYALVAVLAITVVAKLTARQRARAERVTSGSPSLWAG